MSASVIIPTFNDDLRLRWSLESLCIQTDPHFEVIVVNDGGDDSTQGLVREYEDRLDIHYLYLGPKNPHFRAGRARNLGVSHSSGECLIFMDGDIVLAPTGIEFCHRVCQRNRLVQGVRFTIPESEVIPFPGQIPFGEWTKIRSGEKVGESSMHGLVSFWFSMDADLFCQIGGFNETFVGWGGEDTELGLRLMKMGIKWMRVDVQDFCYHLDHPVRHRGNINEILSRIDRRNIDVVSSTGVIERHANWK